MPAAPRILRAKVESRFPSPAFTERQRQRQARILDASQYLMAEEGPHNLTFTNLAVALRISPATLRYHFVDLHALLAAILRRHLRALADALGTVPQDAPDRHRRCRAAYFAASRDPRGGFTEAHLLLVRYRHLLPEDERGPVETMRQGLAGPLGGKLAEEALALLDTPTLDIARIEARLHPAAEQKPAAPTRPAVPSLRQSLARSAAALLPPPDQKPGDWIYSAGIPFAAPARAPPVAA